MVSDPATGRSLTHSVAATSYISAVALAGALAVAISVGDVLQQSTSIQVLILLGLTLLSSSATLTMPSAPVSFSISETFTMTAALLFGPSAGTLIVAADALVISLRAKIYRPRRVDLQCDCTATRDVDRIASILCARRRGAVERDADRDVAIAAVVRSLRGGLFRL